MVVTLVKRAISRTLVRTTSAADAYRRAAWSTVLESESAEFDGGVAPPFAAEASHLDPRRYDTPHAVTAAIQGALYYSYLNVLLTPYRAVLRDTGNTYIRDRRSAAADTFYWRNLYFAPIADIPGTSFVFRSPANNFYHTLADNLPRLYALHQPRYRDIDIALLVSGAMLPFEEYFVTRLLPPNVRIRRVKRNQLHRLENAIFSSYLSRELSGYLPRKYVDFFLERTLPARPRRKRLRVYVTRRASSVRRQIVNEEEVRRIVERFGFQTYALEELALAAQIELFFDAEAVVAPHGAGLTNLLFADHIPVVELHPAPTVFPHYYFLSRAMGHEYRFVCARADAYHSDFTVDVVALERVLHELYA